MNFSTSGHFDQISAKKNFSTLELIGDRIFDADKIFKKKKSKRSQRTVFGLFLAAHPEFDVIIFLYEGENLKMKLSQII